MSCCTCTGLVHLYSTLTAPSNPPVYVKINANFIGLLKESHRTVDWLHKM